MYYVTKQGRVTEIKPEDDFLEVNEYPIAPIRQGYIGVISGFSENEVKYTYVTEQESSEMQPTDLEILMQAQADAELRDFEIQHGQELLAQQMADIELAVLGGAV